MSNWLLRKINRASLVFTGQEFFHHRKRIGNALKRMAGTRVKHKFLFILSPPFCGSTLLNQLISTSAQVSVNNEIDTREGQTLPGVRAVMFDHERRWDEDLDFDWHWIKRIWLKYWDPAKPVLLEKSPPNILRAASIQQSFSPSYFIVFYRNPYAHVESLMRRRGSDVKEAARFAIKCLRHQKKNMETLENKLAISYEELTDRPQAAVDAFQEFLPELNDLSIDQDFTAHNFKSKPMKITNLNLEKIANLSDAELAVINSVFKEEEPLLRYFGYELIPAKTTVKTNEDA
jgi:hypothetical protein